MRSGMGTAAPGGGGWVDRLIGSSQRARVHHYTRYTLYTFAGVELVAVPLNMPQWIANSHPLSAVGTGVLILLHGLCNIQLTRVGLRWYLAEGRGVIRPGRLLAAHAVVTVLIVALVFVSVAAGQAPETTVGALVSLWAFGISGPSLLLSQRQLWAGLGVLVGAMVVGGTAAGMATQLTLVLAVMSGGLSVLMAFTCRVTAWTLRVVNKLDAARETEARLAVAEERLRFGRDMHDVLGRNLSVIALKSELAAQLARRGSPAAVEQMTEVQRIARESQQEMREVVRGYREADLQAELAGARGVLEAAGIRCRIEDGGSTELPVAVQSALGWVVREGTTNVLRHADAAVCVIRLRPPARGGIVAVLEMENDGVRGAGAAPGGSDGTGLRGLRGRLGALGGTLTAEPYGGGVAGSGAAGAGGGAGKGGSFRLTATVPVPSPAGAAARTRTGAVAGAATDAAGREEPGAAVPHTGEREAGPPDGALLPGPAGDREVGA
ncbi:sensor histidine kinase [Streptomyces xiamenensis]|uniref:sensor histidine kinase n=1 Tax=Streptomyces xiamenensis TaxID=408015 RepID=UPI0035D69B76